MTRFVAIAAALLAGPALAGGHASGDAAAGEKEFNKCKSCHMVVSDSGEEIVKGGKTGPNLWGVVGRTAGTAEEFNYGDSLVAAGEKGLVWDEAQFVAYVQDPRAFLQEYLGDNGAKSKMTFKLRDADDATNIWAYLASVSPEPES